MINLDALLSAIQERKALAEEATKAKPGEWTALTTHDGLVWTGKSHIRSEEVLDDRRISHPVAYLISDDLAPVPSSFAEPDPTPAVTAQFIAANSPAEVLRQTEADLRRLERHKPRPWGQAVGTEQERILGWECPTCHVPGEDYDDYGHFVEAPCAELADLAHAYAIPTEETE